MKRSAMEAQLRAAIGKISDEDFERVLDVVDDYAGSEYDVGYETGKDTASSDYFDHNAFSH